MKRTLFLILLIAVIGIPEPVFGMRSTLIVPPEALKDFPIKVTSEFVPDGKLAVRIRINPRDQLKNFHHAELEIKTKTKSFLTTTIQHTTTTEGDIEIYFSAQKNWVLQSEVTLIVNRGERLDHRPDGYTIHLRHHLANKTK